jgi:hypothetical protein
MIINRRHGDLDRETRVRLPRFTVVHGSRAVGLTKPSEIRMPGQARRWARECKGRSNA